MRKVWDVLGFISICLFILSFSIAFILFFTPLYKWSVEHLDIPSQSGVGKEALLHNYDILVAYLTRPWIKTLTMPNFPSSADGLFHFYEVKQLFLLNNTILLSTTILTGVFIHHLYKRDRLWTLIKPFFYLTFVPIFAVVLLYLNFDYIFVLFHKIAFNNDMWIFNASTDPVILALPQEFFMYCFIVVFLLLEGWAIAGYFATKKWGFPKNKQRNTIQN